MTRLALVCLHLSIAVAQTPAADAPKVQTGRANGQVVNDFTELPLRRAHVTLRPLDAGLMTIGVEGDDKGNFEIRDIAPGRYRLVAERDGYLPSATCLHGALRMPPVIVIMSGDSLTSLTFRLRPWAVVAGKIKFDDGEPAVNVRVDAYREYRVRGRRGYNIVTSTRTDDRGEYRMHSMQPGSYFIAAVYERAMNTRGYTEQGRVDADGRELPVMGYATTFYPDTVKLSEAVAVRLEYGQESPGIDLFLRQVRKVKIRGRVMSGVTGQVVATPSIYLQRMDAHNTATLQAPVQVGLDKSGRFEIRDVTPGPYLITAEGTDDAKTLIGRAVLAVAEQDIDDLELMIASDKAWKGQLRVEGGGRLDPKKALTVSLEPRSERASAISAAVRNMGFECLVRGDETYDPHVRNLPDDFYVSAVRVNGTDVLPIGLEGGLASPDKPFEVVLDSRGGRVAGRVVGPDGNVWSGANLALIPEPPEGRLEWYREGAADEYGQFQIRGVAPGKYTLIAWLDEAPCDYYDPEGLGGCRAAGMAVTVSQAGQENVMFTVKPRR